MRLAELERQIAVQREVGQRTLLQKRRRSLRAPRARRRASRIRSPRARRNWASSRRASTNTSRSRNSSTPSRPPTRMPRGACEARRDGARAHADVQVLEAATTPSSLAPGLLARHGRERRRLARARTADDVAGGAFQPSRSHGPRWSSSSRKPGGLPDATTAARARLAGAPAIPSGRGRRRCSRGSPRFRASSARTRWRRSSTRADDDGRVAVLLLLSGVGPDEALASALERCRSRRKQDPRWRWIGARRRAARFPARASRRARRRRRRRKRCWASRTARPRAKR